MKRFAFGSALLLLVAAAPVFAERPESTGLGLTTIVSPGEMKATPEMWFYDQALRRYNDPKTAVREKADFRAVQRERRLEAMRWFGLSNSRPHASSDPFHGDYSPVWVASPGYFPSRWNGVRQP